MTTKKDKAAGRTERAAALLAETRRKERRRNMIVGAAVVAVLAVLLAGAVVLGKKSDDPTDPSKLPAAGQSDYGLAIGDADARHTIVIYEDFLCPFCAELEKQSRENLGSAAAGGKVLLDYRPFVLLGTNRSREVQTDSYSARSLNAFKVVRDAAGDDVAKQFHDLLFENQPSESGKQPGNDFLVKLAVEAGASEDDVKSGIENGDQMSWVIKATKQAQAGSVDSTPNVLLDGKEFRDYTTVDDLAAKLSAAVQ